MSALSGVPAKVKVSTLVPEEAVSFLAVFKSPTSVHEVPSQDSTAASAPPGFVPPAARAAACVPDPPILYLAVFKSATSVQLVPFHDSVISCVPTGLGP